MPKTRVVFYQESDGTVPVLHWLLTNVLCKDKKLFAWCFDAIELLGEKGLELRRPYSAYLRDDVYELRIRYYRENYRILYFYYKHDIAVLATVSLKRIKFQKKILNLPLIARKYL